MIAEADRQAEQAGLAAQIAHKHADAISLPFVKRCSAEPMLPDQVIQGHSRFGFFQDIHDLAF